MRNLLTVVAVLGIATIVGILPGAREPSGQASAAEAAGGPGAPQFSGACWYSHSNIGDPIAYPAPHDTHMHEFIGNDTTDQDSTVASLQADGKYLRGSDPPKLQCSREETKSAYWVPRITWGGEVVEPLRSGAYYNTRTGLDPKETTTTPFGFKLIARPPTSDFPEGSQAILDWHCNKTKNVSQSINDGTRMPPYSCPDDRDPNRNRPTLGVTITFPECWDGESFREPGGASVRQAVGPEEDRRCPAGFEKPVPRLQLFVDYELPSRTGPLRVLGHEGVVLGPGYYHADYVNSERLEHLTNICIRLVRGDAECGHGRD